jgi:glycosyltransferase involved in cell wall biosynthesis
MPPILSDKKARSDFSVVIISHNAARTIEACLKSLKELASEIIVIDNFSDDGTNEHCLEAEVNVQQHDWNGYTANKNLGNSMAKNDWILSIDSDEVLSEELNKSLSELNPQNGTVYSLDRITFFNGKWIKYCGWYPDWKPRLFNRKEVQWKGEFVHETLQIPAGFIEVKLRGKLYHYSYKDLEDHRARIEKYARLSAEKQFSAGKKVSWMKRKFSPPLRFLTTFFLKLGFLDGKNGWIISLGNAKMVRRRYEILEELWKNMRK